MHSGSNQPGGWWDSQLLEQLVDARRRQTLTVLLERSASVGEQELATRLAAANREKTLNGVTKAEAETMRIELRHSHLPALSDVDLLAWDRDAATVTTTDHPALQDPRFRYVIDKLHESWDEVMAHLVVERRRVTLLVLEAHDEPMSKSTLAREVAIREHAAEPSPQDVEEALVALHHVHLPKLERTGLIEYDRDDKTVAYRGHRELGETWFEVGSDGTPHVGVQKQSQ